MRIIVGKQHPDFLSAPEFHVRRPNSTDLCWDVTRDDEQTEKDNIRPENIFLDSFKAARLFHGYTYQVGCLIERSVSLNPQRELGDESGACIIHEECFAMFSQMIRQEWPDMNIPDSIWIMVQTLRVSWVAAHPRVSSERRKAILTAAVAGIHFARLRDLFASTDVQAASIFHSLHTLPDELKLLVAQELESSPLHNSLILLQQFQELLPLVRNASNLLPGEFDIQQDVYVEAASFGGRQYLINVRKEPFPNSTRISVPNTPCNLLIEFDDIGIISLEYVDETSPRMHPKQQINQLSSWYRVIQKDDGSPLVSLKRKVCASEFKNIV